MTTLLLVHGTGVRRASYKSTMERITNRLPTIRPSYSIRPCYWGDLHGATLQAKGVSIPEVDQGRTVTDIDVDPTLALWQMLAIDPLFELGLIAQSNNDETSLPPNALVPGERLARAARGLTEDAELYAVLKGFGLAISFAPSVDSVLVSDQYQRALAVEVDELRPALARALIAESVVRAETDLDGDLPIDGRGLDELFSEVFTRLGDTGRSLSSTCGRLLSGFALRAGATMPIERRRSAITSATTPAAGDILRYLAKGAPIRSFIRRSIASVEPPVVLLAHSLGGVASIDTLIEAVMPEVELIITVGSQAPFLYEIGALPTLDFGEPLPDHLPRWVNVVDHRDLLGFVAEPVFPGRVVDRRIDNRIGFPRAHTSYFGNRDLYRILEEVLP